MQLFDEIFTSPAGLIELVRNDPMEIGRRLEGLDASARYPLLRTGMVSVAVVDPAGARLHATGLFGGPAAPLIDPDRVRAAREFPSAVTIGRELNALGEPVNFLAYASATLASRWALPAADRAIIASRPSSVVVVSANVTSAAADLFAASLSHGLTNLQARLIVAVIHTGSIKAAARQVNIAYATAREAVALALRASGARRLPGLIERITTLAAGIFPKEAAGQDFVVEATGLSSRQLALATCLSAGLTQAAAAGVTGVSQSVAKKEIDQVHYLLGTRSAASLARRLNELKALGMLTDVSIGDIAWDDDVAVPTTFFSRDDGARIAYSDYGPRSGRAVLVFHSSMTTRPVASSLVAALQARGLRVLAMDRPGYGLTEAPRDHPLSAETMFETSARDVALLCKHLKLKTIDVVARGAAQTVAAVHRAYPDLLGRVVLVNPDPPGDGAGANRTPIGLAKEVFLRQPRLIATVARLLASRLTPQKVQEAMARSLGGCEAHLAAALDERHFAD